MRIAGWCVAVACLWLASSAAQAQSVYKCMDKNGTPVFSTDPCAPNAQKIEVHPASGADRPKAAVAVAEWVGPSPADANPRLRLEAIAALDDFCRQNARIAVGLPGMEVTRTRDAESRRDSLVQQQDRTFRTDPAYARNAKQLASANAAFDSARAQEDQLANQRAYNLRAGLAACDQQRDQAMQQRASIEADARAQMRAAAAAAPAAPTPLGDAPPVGHR